MPTKENCKKRIRFDLTIQSSECQLRIAVKHGSLHKIKQLVTVHHADINSPDYSGHTPLVISIMTDQDIECVKLLCRLGANVNYTSDEIYSHCPLHFAAEKNNGQVIELLVEYGASLNAQTNTGCTPLHLAAMNGNLEVARWLCLNGADVNSQETYNGRTPLHFALVRGYKKIEKLLYEFNAHLKDDQFESKGLLSKCPKVLARPALLTSKGPEMLERICLQVVRKHFLRHNAYKNASKLPLPRCMINKILLDEYS